MTNGRRTSDRDLQAQQARQDHDLLIEIKTKVDGVLQLIQVKADSHDVKDHEQRIRDLERRVILAMGALFFAQIGVTLYVAFWK